MPIDITMPRLSDTMESGTIIKWNVKEGDKISAGDVIADVETDKATMEMQAYDDGTLAKIAVKEGQPVSIGTVIAVLAGEDEDPEGAAAAADDGNASAVPKRSPQKASKPQKQMAQAAKVMTEDDSAQPKPATAASAKSQTSANISSKRLDSGSTQLPGQEPDDEQESPGGAGDGRVRVSPVARRLADEYRVDIRSIEGSGPGGRVIKRDVMKAVEAAQETAASIPPAARAKRSGAADLQQAARTESAGELATRVPLAASRPPASNFQSPSLQSQIVPLSNMRQIIAKRLVESKTTIPHYQVSVTFNMDPLLNLRSTLNQQLESMGIKLSINDFLVRCCALAMHQHPEFNASWGEDHIEINADVNIGIAISLPRERGGGLLVATIRNADQKGLRQISFESKSLAEKARTRGLTVQEMSDSTFTISNLGMFGVDNFNAIINPPNSAILAVGAAIEKPVVRDHQLTIGNEMSATLSCDHRVIDGAMGAEYLQTLKQLIENPGTLLV